MVKRSNPSLPEVEKDSFSIFTVCVDTVCYGLNSVSSLYDRTPRFRSKRKWFTKVRTDVLQLQNEGANFEPPAPIALALAMVQMS